VPGDQLRIHVKKLKERGGIFRFSCQAMVDGYRVAEAELTAMTTPKQND
jgi:3-hydroxyacyl-[acyl-carrier-protein] dehydratase